MIEPNDRQDPGVREDNIQAIVAEFAYRQAKDTHVNLETFLKDYQEEQRPEIRERCEDALQVQKILRGQSSPASEVLATDQIPERIGEYEIEGELGRGAMGVVYRAWHPALQRRVALKLLRAGPALTARTIERFRRGAAMEAKLRHPGIVPVLGVGEVEGQLFFTMDHIEGLTLAEHLGDCLHTPPATAPPALANAARPARRWRLGASDQPGYASRVARIVAQVAEALEYAHSHHVIHRDIKPSNILIDDDGRAHLLDFGLGKDLNAESLSRPGDIIGTVYYMSPEQALARKEGLDHRADLFSLGVVLYEMLTRKRPFEGESVERILYEITFRDPAPIRQRNSHIPHDLETICGKALEKKPEHRYARAAEMAQDLHRFLNHESIKARPPSLRHRIPRLLVQHRTLATAAATALLTLIAAFFTLSWWQAQRSIATRVARLQQHLELAPEELDPRSFLSLQATEQALRRQISQLTEAQRATLSAFGESEREFARREQQLASENFAEAQKSGRYATPEKLKAAFQHLVRSQALLPETNLSDGEFWTPRLSVVSDPPGAEVRVQRIDPVYCYPLEPGALPFALGTTPLEGRHLPAGMYRIFVVLEGRGYAEFLDSLETPSQIYRHQAIIRTTADVVAGMELIESKSFVYGSQEDPSSPLRTIEVPAGRVPAFWIDPHEVSNREYGRFVEATGHRPPPHWANGYDSSWDDKPVTMVSFFDAQAYAQWKGKRLPTALEWERAARSTDGRLLPRPERPVEQHVGIDCLQRLGLVGQVQDKLEQYLLCTLPVAGGGCLPGPEGLYHTLGNVRELTETWWAVRQRDGHLDVLVSERIARGSFYLAHPKVDLTGSSPTPTDMMSYTIGFRCAKSVLPRNKGLKQGPETRR